MSTTSASSASSSSNITTLEEYYKSRTVNKELGKDEFLRILSTQLANQDPLEPSSDTDFIAQLAQFSALEQMQSLNSGFTTSQAYSLLGKYVYINQDSSSKDSETIFGKVDGVLKQDKVDYLVVGGNKYKVSDVSGVLNVSDDTSSLDEQILQSANLIGKTVSATYTNDDNTQTTISDVVSKITVKDGRLYATVGDKEVLLSDIKEIHA